MNLPDPIVIDILDFFKTGRFDYLKLGQSKEWILNNFPDPDGFGMGRNVSDAKIWFYGNIELHFTNNELFLIFSKDIINLDGGPYLKLNKWILDQPNKLNLSYIIECLNLERIDFSKRTEHIDAEYIRLHITKSYVVLTFHNEEEIYTDPNEFRLSAFSLHSLINLRVYCGISSSYVSKKKAPTKRSGLQ